MKDITTMKLNDIYAVYETGSGKKVTITRATKEWSDICSSIRDLLNKVENLRNLCKKEGMIVDQIEQKGTKTNEL